MRTAPQHAEWTIGPERDRHGTLVAPTRAVLCTVCPAASPSSTQQSNTDAWALRHTGQTGHRTFRQITDAPLTAAPAPTQLPHEQEKGTGE